MSIEDPYGLLGVPRGATGGDVRKAYRRLARENHPDANPEDPAAEGRFEEIQQAYEVLSNPEKRRAYDESSRPTPRRRSRVATGGRPRRRTKGSVDLFDLLGGSGGSSGGRGEINWQLRVDDAEGIARISKVLGVNLARLSKLAGVQMKAHASFERGGSGAPRNPAGDARSRKPPKPPKTGKYPDVP